MGAKKEKARGGGAWLSGANDLGVQKPKLHKEGQSYGAILDDFFLLKIRYRMYFPSTNTVLLR
jgi:hypothetical protein